MNHDPELGEVSEDEYRYPGPKPQTKEAGIIMIADAVEAASRTLDDPSPARLKGLIRQIIDHVFLDAQLNECDLTLRDLEKISQSFQRVLMGIHHQRVSYPGFDFEKQVEPLVVQDSR
jgi:membrane-associated HD superfamily phosphohydrolase